MSEYFQAGPKILDVDAIPAELRDLPDRWAVGHGKVPYIAGGNGKASSTDPTSWRSFPAALADVEAGAADRLYIAMDDSDDLVGIDLDHCIDPASGVLAPWARVYVNLFSSYTCISPSGEGIRIFIRGKKPGTRCKQGPVECYERERVLSITDARLPGTPATVEHRQDELDAFYRLAFPEPKPATKAKAEPKKSTVDLSGDQLFTAAQRDAKFARLHGGDISGYPSPSEARMAYLVKAAFYSRGDSTLIDRWFRASSLDQTKWERLGSTEIQSAVDFCGGTFYDPNYRLIGDLSDTLKDGPLTAAAAVEAAKEIVAEAAASEPNPNMICIERWRYDQLMAAAQRLQSIENIIANPGLEPGPKLVGVASLLELERRETWRQSKLESLAGLPDGFRIVSRERLAAGSGMSKDSVSRHLKTLREAGIIEMRKAGLPAGHPNVDVRTGEILDHPQRFTAIRPKTAFEGLATATVERVHGGKREPGLCEKHLYASTVMKFRRSLHCAACDAVLAQSRHLAATDESLPLSTIPSVAIPGSGQDAATEATDGQEKRTAAHMVDLQRDSEHADELAAIREGFEALYARASNGTNGQNGHATDSPPPDDSEFEIRIEDVIGALGGMPPEPPEPPPDEAEQRRIREALYHQRYDHAPPAEPAWVSQADYATRQQWRQSQAAGSPS